MALTKIKTGSIADNAVTDAKVADNITAGTAATLATARNINGVSFNGSSAITVTAAAGTLTGNTLASGVTASSLTSVGTIGTGVWNGTKVASAYLDDDTAHLSTNQTFSGVKTFGADYTSFNGTGYIRGDNANKLTLQMGSSGFELKNNAYNATRLTISDSGTATFAGDVVMSEDKRISIGTWDNSGFTGSNAYGLSIDSELPIIHMSDTDTNKKAFFGLSGDNMYIGGNPVDDMIFQTGSGVEKMRIESTGKIKSTKGMYFTGTGLDGTNTGIASSGDGGDLRVYISGNQNYTFSGHTLTIDSQGNGTPAQLTCKNNGSSGWTGAAVNLFYEGSSGNRGQGIYMHSQATDTEWYAGTMYAVDNARYSICYESTASFTEATAAAAHEIFYIGTSGQVWSGGGYNNTHTTSMNHALASYTNELNIMNSWSSGQNTVHFNYRSGNTHTDFSFYNGSSGGHPDLNAASFDTTSDYRMKKSVVNFTDNVCNKIKLLRPITYNWKANTKMNPAKQIGFLAHELQEQLPLAVKGEKDAMSEKDNTKIAPQTIKSEALSSYMMKALQEIITRLEALENA